MEKTLTEQHYTFVGMTWGVYKFEGKLCLLLGCTSQLKMANKIHFFIKYSQYPNAILSFTKNNNMLINT